MSARSTPTPSLIDLFIKPFYVTLRQGVRATLGRPQTTLYPLERRELPPTYRGMNAVIWDLCIGCGICGLVCPNKCLKLQPVELDDDEQQRGWHGSHLARRKGKPERPAINFGHCMFCGFCEDYCPTGAMTMTDFYELADTSREGLIYPARSLKVTMDEPPAQTLVNHLCESPALEAETCIGCSKCVQNCPTNCIIMDAGVRDKTLKSGKTRNIQNPCFDYSLCIGCTTCVEVCPSDSLMMMPLGQPPEKGVPPLSVTAAGALTGADNDGNTNENETEPTSTGEVTT